MLAALLVVSLVATAPADSFSVRYETSWGDFLDTRDGAIARDNCDRLPHSGRARLSAQQVRRIRVRLMALRALDLPTPHPPILTEARSITVPSVVINVEVRSGRIIRRFSWTSERPDPMTDEWRRLEAMGDFLGATLQSLPAYRRLPSGDCLRQ